MNDDRRSGRPNRRTAELLLSGSAPAGEHAALRRLLDDAAAPARPAELAGEDAAAAAFAAARARPAPAGRPWHSALRRFVTVKVAVVAVTVAVFGGVAIAAGTGNLPGQDREAEPPPPAPTRTDPVGRGRHVAPSAPVSSPQARTSAPVDRDTPKAPSRTAPGRGRSADARTSHRPSRPATVPSATGLGQAGQDPPAGRPSVLPTGPNENANPRSKQVQNAPNPRKGPSPRQNRPEED